MSFAWGFNFRFNCALETQLLMVISIPPQNQLTLHILSSRGEIATYIKFRLIIISFAWDFNSRLNSIANWSYKGFGYLDIGEQPIYRDLLFVWYQNTKYWIWGHFDIVWSRFQFCYLKKLFNWSYLRQVLKRD
jgi:hypothetical protein